MAKWEKFTKEEINLMIAESFSIRELATKLGYAMDSGGSAKTIKAMISKLELDISHFTGRGWNKDNYDYSRFTNGNYVQPNNALSALIALRGRKCESCQRETWNDEPIPLEVHHINGVSLNNTLDNLAIYCPNCHAQTENFRGKNINKREVVSDEAFIKALQNAPNVRQALLAIGLTAKGGNYSRAYNLINKHQIKHLL